MSILVEDVNKTFGDVKAVQKANFKVGDGEFISLVGPSGCGKTTLLRLIAGLEVPDQGTIAFGDRLVFSTKERKEVPAEKRGIGMVFQDFALWPHMTVFENVAFGLRARNKTKGLKEKVAWALDKVQLKGFDDRYPRMMSGGQQQRVSFARAIVTEPDIILLDEPLSALDAVLRDDLRNMLGLLTKELNLTSVYVTHDQSEAMAISDRIFVMKDGLILQSGPPEEIYNKPNCLFVADFVGKANFITSREGDHAQEEQKMFRPERLRAKKDRDDDLEFEGKVRNVAYVGDRYEVVLDVDGKTWMSYLDYRPNQGENMKVYLAPKDVHVIKNAEGGCAE